MTEKGNTYREAGVDIDAGEELVRRIKPLVKSQNIPGAIGKIGAFGGFFQPDWKSYKDPVLVSSVDGVGTKLKVASLMGIHNTVGQDLVNHCVDDILACGAFPLYFMDYFATGKLNVDSAEAVISGFVKACSENGCALIGGETAEMPGFYQGEDYDLAGTIVGMVDRDNIVDGSGITEGDLLLGLPSTGLHTNGYSLARKVLLGDGGPGLSHTLSDGRTVGEALLAVHRSYLNPVRKVLEGSRVAGISHITGGGIDGNTKRILPDGLKLDLHEAAWEVPEIFRLIQKSGNVSHGEMLRAFNMGVGMILIVKPEEVSHVKAILSRENEDCFLMGNVTRG